MRKPAFILTLPLAAALSLVPLLAQALELPSWVPFIGEKKQPPTAQAPTARQEETSNADLRKGEAMETRGELDGALRVYRGIIRANALTAAAPKAQFRIARIQERSGEYEAAFDTYSEYTAKYPRGGDFDAVIQAQFNIAKLYLEGQKKKLLGVKIATDFSKSEEMFSGIVKRAPFHRLAPMAQFNVGQSLEKQGKPTEAIAAYNEVVQRYPGDPVADDAQYQIGYVQYRSAMDGSQDQNARQRAREAFEDFVNRYPSSEKVAQARENIKALSGTDVKGTLNVARYYDKVKNYRAAVVYYNEVIRVAPGSPESEQSRKRIDELKSIAGADALRSGPELAQSGDIALARRRAQARVDVASRPDYAGPLINYPYPATLNRPTLRTTPLGPIAPPVEPALPTGDPLQTGPGGTLLPPNLPPPPDEPVKKPTSTEPAKIAEPAKPSEPAKEPNQPPAAQ